MRWLFGFPRHVSVWVSWTLAWDTRSHNISPIRAFVARVYTHVGVWVLYVVASDMESNIFTLPSELVSLFLIEVDIYC